MRVVVRRFEWFVGTGIDAEQSAQVGGVGRAVVRVAKLADRLVEERVDELLDRKSVV